MAFLIRIDIKTLEPVLFPRSRQQGNHFPGLDYIPGAAIRGALAGKLVAEGLDSRIEPLLGHGFLISNYHTPGVIPLPLTLRRCKRYVEDSKPGHLVINTADGFDPKENYSCKGCHSAGKDPSDGNRAALVHKVGYLRPSAGKGNMMSFTESDGHNRLVTHNRIDPETGTTSGSEGEGANLYSAEVLEMGQIFTGYLSWTDKGLRDELFKSSTLDKTGNTLKLGKMKGKGYGHCQITAVEQIDNSTVGREIMRKCGLQPNGKPASITVLQDTLCLDDYLQSCAILRKSELPEGAQVKDNGSWVDFRTVHGFNVKRGVLSPPESVLVAGSTFLTDPFSTEAAVKLEETGIGARRCDGFGIVVCGLAEVIKAQEVWS